MTAEYVGADNGCSENIVNLEDYRRWMKQSTFSSSSEYDKLELNTAPIEEAAQVQDSEQKLYDWIREDRRDAEERGRDMERRLDGYAKTAMEHSSAVEKRIEKRHDEIMGELRGMRSEFRNDMNDVKKDSRATVYWVIGFCGATFLAVAAMVVSVVLK